MRLILYFGLLTIAMLGSQAAAIQKWEETVEGCLFLNPKALANETASWTGSCVDGKISGPGKLTYNYFRSGVPTSQEIVGQAQKGKFEGPATFKSSYGTSFSGTFRNNSFSKGRFTRRNGDWFEGKFRRDRASGRGICSLGGSVGPCYAGRRGWQHTK